MAEKLVLTNLYEIIQAVASLESEVKSFCKSVRTSLYSIDKAQEISKAKNSSPVKFQSVSYLDTKKIRNKKVYGDTTTCFLHNNGLNENIDGITELFVGAFSAFDTFNYEEIKRIFKRHGLDASRIESLDIQQNCTDDILEGFAGAADETSDYSGILNTTLESVGKFTKSNTGKALGGISKTFDKLSNVFLAVSTSLEVATTIHDGYVHGDSATEIYGDAKSDVYGATLEFAAGMGGAAVGGTIGAAIGGFVGSIIPGAGTAAGAAIGTAVGAIAGDAFASWATERLYEDVYIFDKSIKEHVSDVFTRRADLAVDVVSGAANLAKNV